MGKGLPSVTRIPQETAGSAGKELGREEGSAQR